MEPRPDTRVIKDIKIRQDQKAPTPSGRQPVKPRPDTWVKEDTKIVPKKTP